MANVQLTQETRRRARAVALMDPSEQRLQLSLRDGPMGPRAWGWPGDQWRELEGRSLSWSLGSSGRPPVLSLDTEILCLHRLWPEPSLLFSPRQQSSGAFPRALPASCHCHPLPHTAGR